MKEQPVLTDMSLAQRLRLRDQKVFDKDPLFKGRLLVNKPGRVPPDYPLVPGRRKRASRVSAR